MLAKWTRWLGYALTIRFFLRMPGLISLATSTTPNKTIWTVVISAGYLVLVLGPAIVMLVIPRWVEDGHVWAFVTTCAITAWSLFGLLFDGLFLRNNGFLGAPLLRVEFAMMVVSVCVLVAIIIALPDVRDVIRTRRRRNREGLGPIAPPAPKPPSRPRR